MDTKILELEGRVDSLEAMFGRFLINSENTTRRMEKMIMEMREQAEKDRAQAEKFRIEMREQTENDRTQAEKDRKEWNKKWGELANRLGTIAEDIVAPNLPRIAHEQFGCAEEPEDFMVRRWIRHKVDKSKRRDFDAIVVYSDRVFINETKSTPRMSYVDDFVETMKDIDGYFPEYRDKTIIPVFAALYLPDNIIQYLTWQRIYAMAMGDETMELLNFSMLNS